MRRHVVTFFIIFSSFSLHAADTETILYRPFGSAQQQDPIVIKQQLTGDCSGQSLRIKREDAWRCSAAGKIYDPCFIKQYGSLKQAVCPQSPWVGESIEINLPAAVDNSQHATLDMSRTYPWAVELSDGEHCQAVDDGNMLEGLPVHYQCANQSVLVGHLQRCKREWSMLQHNPDGQIETIVVNKAWF